MSYPSPSNFAIAENDAFSPPAWWVYTRDDGSTNVCAATGASVVLHARQALGLSAVPVWDVALQNALVARAQQLAASQPGSNWNPLISTLQQGTTSAAVDMLSLRFAIWVAYYQTNGLRLDAVGIPDGTMLPPWGQTLSDGSDMMVCFDPSRDPTPNVLSQSQLDQAAAQSTYGIRLHSGESLPASTPPVPPGPSGLSTAQIVVIGGIVLIAVGALVMSNRTESTRRETRRNPQRRTRRHRAR